MATAYPGALDTVGSQLRTDIASTDDLDAAGKQHDVMHVNVHGATVALETKLGLTDSNAAANAVLVGTGASTTAWTTSPTVSGVLTASTGIVAPLVGSTRTTHIRSLLAMLGRCLLTPVRRVPLRLLCRRIRLRRSLSERRSCGCDFMLLTL